MPHAPSRRNLALLLLRSREGVMAHFRAILNQHGLTEQQWRVLRALLDDSPLEPRQISDICTISSPSMAGVLGRMDSQRLAAANGQPLRPGKERALVSEITLAEAVTPAMINDTAAKYAVQMPVEAGLVHALAQFRPREVAAQHRHAAA